MCHRLTTHFFPTLYSLIPDGLVRSRPPYDSTVELGWLMCHGLEGYNIKIETGWKELENNLCNVTVHFYWNPDRLRYLIPSLTFGKRNRKTLY